MTDTEQPSNVDPGRADGSEQQANGAHDWTTLRQTLVKSPQWTRNTLRGLSTPGPGNDDTLESQEVSVQKELLSVRDELVRRTREMKTVKRKLRAQTAALRRRGTEVDRLRQTILQLEFANEQLAEKQEAELDASRRELSALQAAYEQFEQQSDELLQELDQKNDLLRSEFKRQNRLSLL